MKCFNCFSHSVQWKELEKPKIVYCSRDCQKSYYIGLKDKEENYDNDDVVGFISSDGIKFKIEKEKLKKIKYFKHILNESFDNYLKLENIDSSMMKLILNFLNGNLDLNLLDNEEMYQLLIAADFLNYTNLIDKLVFKVNDLRNLDDFSYETILKVIFSFRTMEKFQLFVEKFNIEFSESRILIFKKKNTLDVAAFLGKTKILKMLLKEETTQLRICDFKYFYNVAILKDYIKIVKMLLKLKIFPTNDQFQYACGFAKFEIVKLIGNTPNSGIYPLYKNNICFISACQYGQLDTAKFLLTKGANPSDQDNLAFKMALLNQRFEIVTFLLDLNVIDVDTIPLDVQTSPEILELINSLRTIQE